jgi:hypothetical protein
MVLVCAGSARVPIQSSLYRSVSRMDTTCPPSAASANHAESLGITVVSFAKRKRTRRCKEERRAARVGERVAGTSLLMAGRKRLYLKYASRLSGLLKYCRVKNRVRGDGRVWIEGRYE